MSVTSLRILLVDDDEDDYFITNDLLKDIAAAQVTVDWVNNYQSALAATQRREHDVYLFDYHLGAQSGLMLLQEAIQIGCTAPIILLTGQNDHEVDLEAVRLGAADYISKKDLSVQLLDRTIRYAIERSRATEELRQSEERYALVCAGASDGLWDWNLKTDQLYLSSRWKAMLGYDDSQIGDTPEEWFARVHVDDLTVLKAVLTAHINHPIGHFEHEFRMLHKDGDYRWIRTRGVGVAGADQHAVRLVGSKTDITARKNAEEQLMYDALHDALTGLPNRVLFMERLDSVLRRQKRSQEKSLFAVLFLDLDRFKVVNDGLGHAAGDQLLIGVARRFQALLRPCDTVARLGGDEFTILLEDITSPEDAMQVASRIEAELNIPFMIDGNEFYTSTSIGIALGPNEYQLPDEILRDADVAMYSAKGRGSHRFQLFDKTMHQHAVNVLKIENELRSASDRNEFVVHYQPIVCIETGKVNSFEALVRWQHPQRGLLPPSEFIEAAEETGQIMPIGLWVLKEACRQFVSWQNEIGSLPDTVMSVNLSARQFLQPGLVKSVKKIIDDVKIAPHQLRLEITETAVMNDPESALNSLNQLHQLGIELALDDFGIGHSSLSYLQKFPVSVLKIDKSFISKIDCNDKDFELVRIIILLGKSLGIRLVAEGVENRSQLEKLREMGCDCGQGYLFSRPQCTEKTEGLLRQIAKEGNSPQPGVVAAPIGDLMQDNAFGGIGVRSSGTI